MHGCLIVPIICLYLLDLGLILERFLDEEQANYGIPLFAWQSF